MYLDFWIGCVFLWSVRVTLGVTVRLYLLFSGVIGDSGLWRIFVVVEILSPLVFISRPGGKTIL